MASAHQNGFDAPSEQARLAALRSLAILDTLPERDYDDLTAIASFLCDTPISLVSLVDAERQWFKSAHGLSVRETPRAQSFCAHTIADPQTLIVNDAAADPRFHDNPLVLGNPNVRFYAGAPIVDKAGHVLGTVCVIDTKPRVLDARQIAALEALARQVTMLLEQRRIAADQTRIAEEAHQIAARLTLAAEAAGLGLFSWDAATGKATWENDRMYSIFARAPSQGPLDAAHFVAEVVLPTFAKPLQAAIDHAFAGGGRLFWQGKFRRSDGTKGWLELTGQIEHGSDGRPVRLLGAVSDISARMEAEAALRSTDERTRLAYEAARIASWDWNASTGTLQWNGDTAWIYGRAPHELATFEQWLQCVHPEDRQPVLDALVPVLNGTGEYHGEYRVCWPDGSIHSIVSHGTPVLPSLVAPDGAGGAGAHGSYGDVSSLTPESSDTQGSLDSLESMEQPAGDRDGEAKLPRAFALATSPDGALASVAAASPHPARGLNLKPLRIVGVNLNATERRLAEVALRQAEKLAAVGRLASAIAHEMNNPLESVTNLLYLARHADGLPEIVEDYLDTAERELRRVSAIMSQTLRFHRQSTNPRPVSAKELFDSVLSLYQGRLINAGIEVLRRERAAAPVLCFDGEVRQVLNNLIGNAIDAMYASGAGRLLLRSREATHWPTGRRGLLFTVADTGTGMTPNVRRRLFDAFFTTKGISGTGLGLWVSREITDRHDGRLRLRSSAANGSHRGTVFTLFLPYEASAR